MSISFIGSGGSKFRKLTPYLSVLNSWISYLPLGIARYAGGMFVYNGKVYVIGGMTKTGSPTSAVEIVDIMSMSRYYGQSLPKPLAHFAHVFLNNKFYVIGGITTGGNIVKDILVYDPEQNQWSSAPVSLPKGIARASAARLDKNIGKVITVGIKPSSYGGSADYIKIYVEGVGWVEQMPHSFRVEDGVPKADFNVSNYIGAKITRIGLHHTNGGWSDPTDVWIWDKSTGAKLYNTTVSRHTWDRSLPNYFEYVNVDWIINGVNDYINTVILVMGGLDENGNIICDTYEIDISNQIVTKRSDMKVCRENHACAELGGKIYCFGGDDGESIFNSIEEYDPSTDSWRVIQATLPNPATGIRSTNIVINGKTYILLAGD